MSFVVRQEEGMTMSVIKAGLIHGVHSNGFAAETPANRSLFPGEIRL
jgi:hypothetical protein